MQLQFPHQPNLTPIDIVTPIWLGQKIASYEGKLSSVRGAIPTFERQPFFYEDGENPHLDVIVRQPIGFEQRPKIPVSIVSKNYDLIQHHELLDVMESVFQDRNWDPASLDANLTISEFGERIWIRIFIPGFVQKVMDGHELNLEIHIFNSVDRSCAMEIRFGWFRLVCSNGMWVGSYRAFKRIHSLLLAGERYSVSDFLRQELISAQHDRETFERWCQIPIHESQLIHWADQKVSKTWGVQAAARVLHIAQTGQDGKIKPAFEKLRPQELTFYDERGVPGSVVPARNAFHVAQVLSWIASRQPSLESRFEKMGQMQELMDSLIQSSDHR